MQKEMVLLTYVDSNEIIKVYDFDDNDRVSFDTMKVTYTI